MNRQRLENWARKLLDFSARNRLLDIPAHSANAVEIACADIAALEDRVNANDAALLQPARPDMTAGQFKKRLDGIYRQAKRDLEETGLNTLYLALGALEWQDPKAPAREKSRFAPLLLVPVRLERKTIAEGIKMFRLDEDTALNPTLAEFLRSQFGMNFEGLDPLPQDASGTDVNKVLEAAALAISGKQGWAIHKKAYLGCFSFGKFTMWKDMTLRAEELARHALVGHLLGGASGYDDGVEIAGQAGTLAAADFAKMFCPASADSSQLAAVLYSGQGKTFVLHGPPGTGKSQTITNMIAHNLALGRRVLFVSEKKAALDVVKSRLDEIGLALFCLELHSNKTEKSRFYRQIKDALDAADSPRCPGWEQSAKDLAALRDSLDSYVKALHAPQKNGLSAYDCFSSRIAPGPEPVAIDAQCLAFTSQEREELEDVCVAAAGAWRDTSAQALAALEMIDDFEWSPAKEREIAAKLDSIASRPKFLRALFGAFAKGISVRRAGFRKFADALENARANIGESRGAMRYRKLERQASAKLGRGFAGAVEGGFVESGDAAEVFRRSFAAKSLDEILASSPELASFSGAGRENAIEKFRALDSRFRELAQREVVARLSARLPARRGGSCPEGSELGILKRECEKKSRQKAVRTILSLARSVIPALKPCFLMSPLSVAQYLPLDAEPFDLIVFDEASQIPVWDAIGVIARGKQLVVVGDPKQMPPTSFFRKGDSVNPEDVDDDEDLTIEDQESILDECLVAGVCSTRLCWHYRSRHESLIAFSNEHYYDGRLCTFPAAALSPSLGVKHVFVEGGTFARTGAKGPKVNEAEAKALVDYICAGVKAPGAKRRSIGVVTFSLPQQKLVQNMIEERRAADPELEKLLPEEGEGAYFVKNLENVQGDESDVILFSVGYAPDETGRFTMNFGPLNLAGGERRLNVAITRAKEQVVVFASIRSAQIDAAGKAQGVADLRDFLAYAERVGQSGQAGACPSGTAGGKDALAATAADFLRKNGYEVDCAVGSSQYKIDLAVREKGNPGKYLAGIECDGLPYANQPTAQDRDLNRAGVLKGLGWRMLRIWSADWALDGAKAKARLLDSLQDAGSGAAAMDAPAPAGTDSSAEPRAPRERAGGRVEHRVFKPWTCRAKLDHKDFSEAYSYRKITSMLREVANAEGPVFESVMRKRVSKAWGLTRNTDEVRRIFDLCMPGDCTITKNAAGRVFWPEGSAPESYREYRIPGRAESSKRPLDEIPPEELAAAMREIVADCGACPDDSLFRETLKIFDLGSLTPKARQILSNAKALV